MKGAIFTLNEPNAPRLNPALANEIGLNESILFLQIEFWIRQSSTEEHKGRHWTYQSIRKMQEFFSFWSIATINRTIQSLENKNLISIGNFNKANYDRTRWFSINFNECAKLKSIKVAGYETQSAQDETPSAQNETRSKHNETTIPEITTEKTTKNIGASENDALQQTLKDIREFDAMPSASVGLQNILPNDAEEKAAIACPQIGDRRLKFKLASALLSVIFNAEVEPRNVNSSMRSTTWYIVAETIKDISNKVYSIDEFFHGITYFRNGGHNYLQGELDKIERADKQVWKTKSLIDEYIKEQKGNANVNNPINRLIDNAEYERQRAIILDS